MAESTKRKNDLDKKTEELIKKQKKINDVRKQLEGSSTDKFLSLLGVSPVDLLKNEANKVKRYFPIPKEQTIIWADAEFDLRPSGIVCTEKGIYIKTNTEVFEKKVKDSTGKKTSNRSMLFFYKWEDFEPGWFISDDPDENKVLLVEEPCRNRFISACKKLSDFIVENSNATSNLNIDDDYIGDIVTKTAPAAFAGVDSSESAVFVEQKSHINSPAGHGEMAEEFLTMLDRLAGRDATVVGRDNAKNGADRLVDGVFVQTKFYNTARGTVDSAFSSSDGMYRYMKDGKPMKLEVPKDQYEKAVSFVEEKIKQGKIDGVTDPKEAKNIVAKAKITYEQAVNLTKPGTIESLTYDALTGVVTCSYAMGISFVVTVFLTWRKTGDIKQAIKAGASTGLQVFGVSFIQHMLVSQIARTGLASALMAPSQYIVGKLGFQHSATIVNGIRALSGKGAIHGIAASKHLAKILRSNAITSAIAFAVFSVPDTYKLASSKMSLAQYAKNITVLVGSIAGGAGGAVAAGVAAAKVAGTVGTTVSPGVGTAVGIVGGFVGGVVGSKIVDVVGDILHEDDSEILGRLFNAYVSCMISEYLLDASEIDKLMESLDKTEPKKFKAIFTEIYKSENQEMVIREFLVPYFDNIAMNREEFTLPSPEEIVEAMLEECD